MSDSEDYRSEEEEIEEAEEDEEIEQVDEEPAQQTQDSSEVQQQEPEQARQTPKLSVPKITPPKLPEGEVVDLEDIHRKRMDKDLTELQALINAHFEQRKKDEEELEDLRTKIEQRKSERAEQIRIRQEREKERMAQEREERKKKEEEEESKRLEEEARKKAAIANMSLHYGGYLARAEKNKPNKRQTEREKKRKLLAERRKPLNIDHLSTDKLREKAQELWDWLYTLEDEKYDHEQRINRQKYDINQLRQRVNEYMGKFSKTKRSVKIAGHGGIGAAAAAFK
ncbi:troponin T, fast skeletal muscle isoforms-like isoform X2 [Clavelina lepadiformis]|uniref:troponin T, fast skeletal muscle isoforms-like isoform X2 n=1 Tax=Clavelina lepadiformis TaxID=159417 RepID=UPI0040414D36